MATIRQIRVYNLHKRVCKRIGIAQWNFHHRPLAGAITTGLTADVYNPLPGVQDLPQGPAIPVWFSQVPQVIRGAEMNAADTGAGLQWIVRGVGQMPAIDDTGTLLAVLDDDFLESPAGVRYKIENPLLSADESYWTFSLSLWN